MNCAAHSLASLPPKSHCQVAVSMATHVEALPAELVAAAKVRARGRAGAAVVSSCGIAAADWHTPTTHQLNPLCNTHTRRWRSCRTRARTSCRRRGSSGCRRRVRGRAAQGAVEALDGGSRSRQSAAETRAPDPSTARLPLLLPPSQSRRRAPSRPATRPARRSGSSAGALNTLCRPHVLAVDDLVARQACPGCRLHP